ncbi:MAG: methionyl-tRNA formyltransferase [Bacteroidales bacterium]|nr:methionyl-tRNA formyltransferase [Bacteroidales bacterium]
MEKKTLKIVFMGTPEFATASLQKLIEDKSISVSAVITAPDKPAGRGKKLQESPVKLFVADKNIPVFQPANLKDPSFIEELKSLDADLFVVVAFRMLPEIIWSMPPLGTINLHASLLPDYRGAAPINWVIINGEKKTGVTTFFIEKEIDTGNILFSDEVNITPDDTAGDLHDKLKITGADLLVKTVKAIQHGNFSITRQQEIAAGVSLKSAPKIFKEDCRINWNDTPENIHNFIRGLSPYPTAWTEISKSDTHLSLKIFKAEPVFKEHNFTPASIHTDNKIFLKVAVNNGFINILELQLEGKKKLHVSEFLRGFPQLHEWHLII